jgi:Fe-S-cluster containining protein
MRNPCVGCGACCAAFRVQFYWREASPADHKPSVPAEFVQELTATHNCMLGTADKHRPKCAALKGRIGHSAQCSIYAERPTPCREFKASFSDGVHQPRCDQARLKHGLPALRREDYLAVEDSVSELIQISEQM